MQAIRSSNAWSRRRAVIAFVMLIGVGAYMSWRMTHRCDTRLVGRWVVTYGAPATAEEFNAATDPTTVEPKTEWTFHSDGKGRQDSLEWVGSLFARTWSEFRWWTNGDRLCIKWGTSATGWEWVQETLSDGYGVARGLPTEHPLHKYTFAVEGDALIRVEAAEALRPPRYDVITLTRNNDRRSPRRGDGR